jgi:hypothetical protein
MINHLIGTFFEYGFQLSNKNSLDYLYEIPLVDTAWITDTYAIKGMWFAVDIS